ncbi:MAG: hypothetical protein K2Z25_26255 [Beijerinckiaceae bacterium]|nr:hypothetical protein [Beijerinckiaceae bacterium]
MTTNGFPHAPNCRAWRKSLVWRASERIKRSNPNFGRLTGSCGGRLLHSQNVVSHSALACVGAIVLLPIAIALAFAGNVRASDGDLQRALLESGCVQATIKTLPPLGQTLLYEANCFGSSHKLLKIACASGRCVVDSPRAPRDEADDD